MRSVARLVIAVVVGGCVGAVGDLIVWQAYWTKWGQPRITPWGPWPLAMIFTLGLLFMLVVSRAAGRGEG